MKSTSIILLAYTLTAAGLTAQTALPGLIAHRGASHAAPENTVAAMRLAWKEGADGIEADFHLSADREVVCIHDADTLRTTGTKLIVKDTPWSELAKLEAGSWKSQDYRGEPIPRFADILDVLPPGKILFVEIKSGPATIAPVRDVLAAHKGGLDPKQIIIISFDAEAVAEARRLLPGHEAHLISSLKEYGDPEKMKQLDATLARCGAQGFQFKHQPGIGAEFVAAYRQRGLKLDSWVINDAKLAAELLPLGLDFFTTDRPGPLRAELQQANALK
jgi:glycerophosphoryl diester phosphodiesterase